MKNSQNIQITGSSGVTLGDIHQTIGPASDTSSEAVQLITILFLAANPEGTAPLRLDQEVKAIDEALRCSRLAKRFKLEQGWAVGDRELQDSLLRWQPDIVHLSGHGTRKGRMMLESDPSTRDLRVPEPSGSQSAEDPQVQALARVFAAARGRIRCVVLNACHSEGAARAIALSAGCVVGMSRAIADSAAIRFSWAFYNALGYGLSLKAAFEAGTAQMGMLGLGQENVPRLYAAGVDPNGVDFA